MKISIFSLSYSCSLMNVQFQQNKNVPSWKYEPLSRLENIAKSPISRIEGITQKNVEKWKYLRVKKIHKKTFNCNQSENVSYMYLLD